MRIIDAHAHITSAWEELGIVRDLDNTIRGVEGVREFTQAFGADRVLLGTGYGIQYAGIGVGKVKTAEIREAARALVGRDNARRLLRIE